MTGEAAQQQRAEIWRNDAIRQAARQEGWNAAVRWLRERADFHSGNWMTMDPKDAIRATANEMETLVVSYSENPSRGELPAVDESIL